MTPSNALPAGWNCARRETLSKPNARSVKALPFFSRWDESEKIYRDVPAKYEILYGAVHYDIAAATHNLANVRFARGDYAQAEALMRRTLALKEQLLGAEYPDTALSINNLGVLLHALNRDAKARGLFERAFEIFDAVPGAEHPQTKMARENLAVVLSENMI